MSQITYVDKEACSKFFWISNGYIFTFLNNHNIPFNKDQHKKYDFRGMRY